MGRPPCCDKSNVKKGPWTAEEDAKILAYVSTHGLGNWSSVPKKAGLKRCGKSCRLRYTNYLRPDLKRESFTPEEEQIIIYLHGTIGSRWAAISNCLPGRTDNDVKNYWNTKLKKKLYERGIDPVTHKPISQIINSLGGLPITPGAATTGTTTKTSTSTSTPGPSDARISCLNRELKNMFLSRSEAIMDPVVGLIQNVPDATAGCDLLAQLHAIKLVADMSNAAGMFPSQPPPPPQLPLRCMISPSFPHTEFSLETSSSSSNAAPPPYDELNWSDFLVDDVTIDITDKENAQKPPPLPATTMTTPPDQQTVQVTPEEGNVVVELMGDIGAAADEVFGDANATFLESLLGHDVGGMGWEFPAESIILDDGAIEFTKADAL